MFVARVEKGTIAVLVRRLLKHEQIEYLHFSFALFDFVLQIIGGNLKNTNTIYRTFSPDNNRANEDLVRMFEKICYSQHRINNFHHYWLYLNYHLISIRAIVNLAYEILLGKYLNGIVYEFSLYTRESKR